LEPLFSEFPATDFESWKAQLIKDLKTDSADRYLHTRIEELQVPV
jgi:hypothetical protein